MDDVVKRRLVGALALVGVALLVATLLPQPGQAPGEPGVERVTIDLDAAPGSAQPPPPPDSALPPSVAAPTGEAAIAAPPATTSVDLALAQGMDFPADQGAGARGAAGSQTRTDAAPPPPKTEPAPARPEAVAKPEPALAPAKPPALKLDTATPRFEAPTPVVAAAAAEPPKPEVAKPATPTPATPKPATPKPEAKTETPKPEARLEAPKPAVSAPPAKPAVVASAPPVATSAAPPSASGWAVQVGGFLDLARAHGVQDKLKAGGFATYISPLDTAKGTLYRVRAGPFASKDKAAGARGTIVGLGFADAAVVQK